MGQVDSFPGLFNDDLQLLVLEEGFLLGAGRGVASTLFLPFGLLFLVVE